MAPTSSRVAAGSRSTRPTADGWLRGWHVALVGVGAGLVGLFLGLATDDGWSVTVNSVDFNAADRIQAENQFNEPAPAESRYALVNLSVTNNSAEPGDPLFTIIIGIIGSQNRMWDGANAFCSAVIPEDMNIAGELFPSGSFTGNECRVVPEAEVADGSRLIAVSSLLGDPVLVRTS
ncbi:MAG: hypothetical protein ACRD0A_20610 [Acidimicrobiales bacterium]